MRAPITSEKKIVQQSSATVATTVIFPITIAEAVQVGNVNTVSEVPTGSVIKAVYAEMWLRGGSTTSVSAVVTLEKRPGPAGAMTTTESSALGNYDNKKNVLFTFQGLINDVDSYATPAIKGWIKVPKGKQRFGLADKLVLNIHNQGAADLQVCGFFIYKNYT